MKIYKVGIWMLAALLACSAPAISTAQDQLAGSGFISLKDTGIGHSLGIDTVWQNMLQEEIQRALSPAAIDPDDYVCDPWNEFRFWVIDQVLAIDPLSLSLLNYESVFLWAIFGKILADHDGADEYIGVHGEQTREQIKRHKDNRRFWDIPSDDILLMGAHGSDISDTGMMLEFLSHPLVYGDSIPEEVLLYLIGLMQTVIEGGIADFGFYFSFPEPPPAPILVAMPGIPNGYDNPLFTLNAIAFSSDNENFPLTDGIPDKIVMGDGIIEGFDAIGLGQNGPDFVHAHEFAHHVQYEIGAFESDLETQPERTRRTELMADAFAAYYSSHARGASMQAKRVQEIMRSAYVVGSCDFENPDFHGTHNQRLKAAAWGSEVAASAQKQGDIESAHSMLSLFDAYLPELVAPDAP